MNQATFDKKLLKVFYPASDSDVNIRRVGERQVKNYLNPTDAHGKDANIFLEPFRVNQKHILIKNQGGFYHVIKNSKQHCGIKCPQEPNNFRQWVKQISGAFIIRLSD